MTTAPWYKPEPPELGRETRKYMRNTGKSLAQLDVDGPYEILKTKGIANCTAMQIGWDLIAHGFVGWHLCWKTKRYKPGPDSRHVKDGDDQ